MRKVGIILIIFFVVVLAIGCKEETAGNSNAASDKLIIVSGVNATNEAWVFDKTAYGSTDYKGELDAIYADDFTIDAGAEFLTINANTSDYNGSDSFTETSATTYEIRIQLVAGGPSPTDEDEQYVYDPFSAVTDFIIKGTYGEPVVIEWNGSEFKQIK